MLISTRLCIIVMQLLSEAYYQGRYTTVPEIAERYKINPRAIYPALKSLTRHSILKSRVGGRCPGYMFVRDPQTISLFEIICLLEGSPKNSCCMDEIDSLKCDCTDKNLCQFYVAMNTAYEDTKKHFSRVSVAELFSLKR